MATCLFSLKGKRMATYPISLQRKGEGITTPRFFLNGKRMGTPPFSLKGKGGGMTTPPFSLKGGDGHLAHLSKGKGGWAPSKVER